MEFLLNPILTFPFGEEPIGSVCKMEEKLGR